MFRDFEKGKKLLREIYAETHYVMDNYTSNQRKVLAVMAMEYFGSSALYDLILAIFEGLTESLAGKTPNKQTYQGYERSALEAFEKAWGVYFSDADTFIEYSTSEEYYSKIDKISKSMDSFSSDVFIAFVDIFERDIMFSQ